MSDRWLSSEARWAREQALDAEKRLEELRNPKALYDLRKKAGIDLARIKFRHRAEMHDAKAEVQRLDDEHLAQTVERLERDRRYWIELAEGHESRLASKDDAALFATGDP